MWPVGENFPACATLSGSSTLHAHRVRGWMHAEQFCPLAFPPPCERPESPSLVSSEVGRLAKRMDAALTKALVKVATGGSVASEVEELDKACKAFLLLREIARRAVRGLQCHHGLYAGSVLLEAVSDPSAGLR